MPGARCTRGLVCQKLRIWRTRAYRAAENTPTSPAQWLYGLLRALPGERIRLVTVDCGKLPTNLAPATGVRTTRLGRTPWRFVRRETTPDAKASTASRIQRVATIMIRPSCGRETGGVIILIYRIVKRNIFNFGA